MYVTMVIERGGVTANTMACLLKLGYLLLVVPDTKMLLNEKQVVRREYGYRGIVPRWTGR